MIARLARTVAGWALAVLGVALVPLPGPGTLVLVAGLGLLAPRYAWARRWADALRRKAVEAAALSVATPARTVLSVAVGVLTLASGVVWWAGPTIPVLDLGPVRLGPQLPLAGAATGIGVCVSALAALAVTASSARSAARVRRVGLEPTTQGL